MVKPKVIRSKWNQCHRW